MIEQYDPKEAYCRKLGHHVAFRYCRLVNQGLPCPAILDCWFEQLPLQEFLQSHYTAEELQRISASPPGKLQSILEILSKVQSRA